MRNGLSFCLAVLLLSCAAQAKTGASHQSATVIGVQKHEVESSWVGSNGSDAPVRADGYLYDVALKVDCAIYVVRYQSSFDQPPPIFAPDRRVDVRVEKHVLYATMPGGEDAKMPFSSVAPTQGCNVVGDRRAVNRACRPGSSAERLSERNPRPDPVLSFLGVGSRTHLPAGAGLRWVKPDSRTGARNANQS